MTKEELWDNIVNASQGGAKLSQAKPAFDIFFNSNICILKGKNRHPQADIWHKVIEGVKCELWSSNDDRFIEVMFSGQEIRIKPSEPVYEWQWLMFSKTKDIVMGLASDFYTEAEINEDVYRWIKIEETKRIRKCLNI